MPPQTVNKNLYYMPGSQGSGSASFVPGNLTDPTAQKITTKSQLLPAFSDYYNKQFYAPAEAQIKLNQGIDYMGNIGGYYSRINPQARQLGYQNWQAAGGVMPGDINENNLFDMIQKTGWSGLDRSQLEQYFSGQALPSEYITNPETGNMQLASQYQEGLQQKQDIASGKLVQIGSQNGQPLYAPAGSPAALQSQGQNPASTTLPQYQSMLPQQAVGGAPRQALQAPTIALQPGSTNTQGVKQLQDYLVSQGLMTQEQVNTGYGTYGPQTTAAVKALQEKLGVDNTSGPGVFGPRTMAALGGAPVSTSQVGILSSKGGADKTKKNSQELAQMEQYLIKSGDTLSKIAQQRGTTVQDIMKNNPQITDPNKIQAGAMLSFATSQATQNMMNAINQATEQGISDPVKLAALQQSEAETQSALAKASAARDANDPVGLNQAMTEVKQLKAKYESDLADYNKSVIELRAQRQKLSLPGEREKQLAVTANNIKTEIDQIQLANERRKFEEFSGQTASFAGGRNQEFDIRKNFEVMSKSLELQNVLSEMGIEQGARQMQLKSTEQALSDFKDDYQLQQGVNEKLMQAEEKVIERVDKLSAEAKTSLFKLMESLDNVDPNTLTPQTKQQLQQWAQTANVPYDIINDAMKATYQRQTVEDALKQEEKALVGRQIVEVGGKKLLVDKNGNTVKDLGVAGAGGAPGEQLYSGLSPQTATAVRGQVSKFSSEPMVQNFATIQDGHLFAQSIEDKTKNPADHQALIYSLAKALDPGSVVREGEYATAQKYAQSWIAAYGKGVEQALAGTGFLSESAVKNIKKVIEQKYTSSKQTYDSLNKNYKTGINSLTGRSDGDKFLRDYVVQGAQSSASGSGADFSDIQSNLKIDTASRKAYIPRDVWMSLGDRMDGLLAEAEADGYTLLVTD
jgi:LysM repeat protein